MERPTATMFRIGACCVNPTSGEISRDGETTRVEVRTMRLLLCRAEHAGEVVSIDDSLNQVWSEVTMSPDSVYQAVASLRRLLGDDPKQPTYIATVPRLGYRMVATVGPCTDRSVEDRSMENQSTEDRSIAHAASFRTSHNGHPAPSVDAKTTAGPTHDPHLRASFTWAAVAALCLPLVVAFAFLFHRRIANSNQPASAVFAAQPQIIHRRPAVSRPD